jgi:hypothetical protein
VVQVRHVAADAAERVSAERRFHYLVDQVAGDRHAQPGRHVSRDEVIDLRDHVPRGAG